MHRFTTIFYFLFFDWFHNLQFHLEPQGIRHKKYPMDHFQQIRTAFHYVKANRITAAVSKNIKIVGFTEIEMVKQCQYWKTLALDQTHQALEPETSPNTLFDCLECNETLSIPLLRTHNSNSKNSNNKIKKNKIPH